jgi:hypothetical protein
VQILLIFVDLVAAEAAAPAEAFEGMVQIRQPVIFERTSDLAKYAVAANVPFGA